MVILAKLPAADREETELVQLDREFLSDCGPERVWVPAQWQQYADARAAIHARYTKRVVS